MRQSSLRPGTVAASIVGFLLLRAALFAITTAGEYALYRDYAIQARDTSLAELHRARDIEYPPLATLFGVGVLYLSESLPEGTERLTAWRPEDTRGPSPARFEVALGLALFGVDVACLALVYVIARRIYPEDDAAKQLGRLGLYVAATTAIGLILYDRQDLVVGLIALAAMACFVRGWSIAAYGVLAAGVAYKLVPILLLPFFVLAFAAWRTGPADTARYARGVVREALLAGAILAIMPVLMYLTCGGERAFVFLSFHSTRGLQLESSAAWPVMLIAPQTEVGHSFGSHTLRGELSDRVAGWTTPLTLLATVASILIAARGFHRAARAGQINRNGLAVHLIAGSLLAWVGFILCTKVGSPQYLLWLGPLVALLPLRGSDRWCAALLLAAMIVTTLIFPCQYAEVKGQYTGPDLTWSGPTPIGFVLLAAKSILLVAAFVWLSALVWRGRWFVPHSSLPPEAS